MLGEVLRPPARHEQTEPVAAPALQLHQRHQAHAPRLEHPVTKPDLGPVGPVDLHPRPSSRGRGPGPRARDRVDGLGLCLGPRGREPGRHGELGPAAVGVDRAQDRDRHRLHLGSGRHDHVGRTAFAVGGLAPALRPRPRRQPPADGRRPAGPGLADPSRRCGTTWPPWRARSTCHPDRGRDRRARRSRPQNARTVRLGHGRRSPVLRPRRAHRLRPRAPRT